MLYRMHIVSCTWTQLRKRYMSDFIRFFLQTGLAYAYSKDQNISTPLKQGDGAELLSLVIQC